MRSITGEIGYIQRVPEHQGDGWLLGIVGDMVPYRKTACDLSALREGVRVSAEITGTGHFPTTGQFANVRAVPIDPELFNRSAPRWNCVDFPEDGPHYIARDGSCQWCGKTRDQLKAENAHEHDGSQCGGYRCPNCGRESGNPFICSCGAGQANHVLVIPD